MDDFGNYLGTAFGRIGSQVASGVAAHLDGVAVSVNQALREHGLVQGQEQQEQQQQQQQQRRGRSSSNASASNTRFHGPRSASSSAAGTPVGEEANRGSYFDQHRGYQPTFMGGGGGGGESSRRSNRGSNSDDGSNNMQCYCCGTNFSFFSRKKQCNLCKKTQFCSTCCPKSSKGNRVCSFCKILLKIPPVRAELMNLPVKDLQRYLISKRVNTKSCVEKKDLVELVIKENGGTPAPSSLRAEASSSSLSGGLRGRDPIERQKSFPKAYTESTHRAEWLAKYESDKVPDQAEADRTSDESTSDLVRDFVVISPPGAPADSSSEATTPTSPAGRAASPGSAAGRPPGESSTASTASNRSPPPRSSSSSSAHSSSAARDASAARESPTRESPPVTPAAAEPEANPDASTSDAAASVRQQDEAAAAPSEPKAGQDSPKKAESKETANLQVNKPSGASTGSASPSSSPRKFANQGVVYLSEITREEDLHELSAKQMKDILAMNRVAFKGVLEKEELFKYVLRLWKQEQKAMEGKDNMEDSELCKVCMDNPVDCVMLECGHMCTCTTCGKQMNECPICRQYVVRVVKTFKS